MARILIVDDEEMDRILLSEILLREGHEPFFAPNGQAALKIWRRGGIDLVITDIVMPQLDGLELLNALREEDPWVRVIAMSGVTARKLNEAARSGAHAILVKPVDPRELVQAISSALDEPDALDSLDV
jgi:CheY-like chemotaxis protein